MNNNDTNIKDDDKNNSPHNIQEYNNDNVSSELNVKNHTEVKNNDMNQTDNKKISNENMVILNIPVIKDEIDNKINDALIKKSISEKIKFKDKNRVNKSDNLENKSKSNIRHSSLKKTNKSADTNILKYKIENL